MKAVDVEAALAKAYCEPKHALFYEVPTRPDNSGRKIDALSIALWQSLNFEITGFEIKVSRSDWLRELKDPAKGEALFQFCHQFYVVTPKNPPNTIIRPDEVPANWGWIEVTRDKIYTVKKAPKLSPEPLTVGLMVAILRREGRRAKAAAQIAARDALRDEREELEKRARYYRDEGARGWKAKAEAAEKAIADFEAATGIPLKECSRQYGSANATRLGDCIRLITETGMVDAGWNSANLKRHV